MYALPPLHCKQSERGYTAPPAEANGSCNICFHCAFGFSTLRLAYMLDSLVRVSRRVEQVADLFTGVGRVGRNTHDNQRTAVFVQARQPHVTLIVYAIAHWPPPQSVFDTIGTATPDNLREGSVNRHWPTIKHGRRCYSAEMRFPTRLLPAQCARRSTKATQSSRPPESAKPLAALFVSF